jgi:hypothetical protein
MLRRHIRQLVLAALGVVIASGSALAQGYGGTSLQSIQRQDIGTGYSVGSLNQIALRNAQGYVGNTGAATRRAGGGSGLGLSAGPTSKPFSSYSPAPTVSPYLNLFRDDFGGDDDFNYNTLVRPMLQQQQFNQQMQRQSLELGKRLQSIAAQADYNAQGSESQYPTGHKTVFNYLGHFYPQPARR